MSDKLWITASAVALLWGGAAQAQDATRTASPDGAQTTVLGDVVVTAERRTTNLQQTPIAASVLSGQQLQDKGVTEIESLQFSMPSVTVQNSGQGNSFNVRGIGKTENNSSIGVGVVTYRDGVAVFPAYFQNEPFFDIASLELLRGPQGTFAGQNATGGALFITERNPDLTDVNGYISAEYGNYDHVRAQGAVNLPISDTLAVRLAFNREERDSFYKVIEGAPTTPGTPGEFDSESYRASVLWQPTDALRVLFKADYSRINLGGYPTTQLGATDGLFKIRWNGPSLSEDETFRSVLNVNYQFANGIVLRSITGYQDGTTFLNVDADGTASAPSVIRVTADERIWSQEFNLISPDTGRLGWVLGAYYQHDRTIFPQGGSDTTTILPPIPFPITLTVEGNNPKTTSAAFGQITYDLTPSLELQLGARYSRSTAANTGVSAIPLIGLALLQDDRVTDEKVTGKIGLNWTVDPNNFVYGFVATGHKTGGLNGPNLALIPPLPFDSEEVVDVEAGWKSTLMDGRLKTQVGAYYNIYQNFQVILGDPVIPTLSSILNVTGDTKIYGVEATAQGRFGAWGFDVGASLAHSELPDFYAADARGPLPGGCDPDTGPATASCVNVGGNAQTYAPELTLSAGVEYDIALGGGTLTPRIDYSHISETWATIFANEALGDRLEARDIVNAQLTYDSGNGWKVQAYGTNLGDLEYVGAVRANQRYAGPPRQYGVRLTRTF
jgi:iron complex outermembrane receptor protein